MNSKGFEMNKNFNGDLPPPYPIGDRYSSFLERGIKAVVDYHTNRTGKTLNMYEKRLIQSHLSSHAQRLIRAMFQGTYMLKEIRDDESV